LPSPGNFLKVQSSVTWTVCTPVAQELRELGVPFEWLTEHAESGL
jgi:hypothetical protein